ncbi:MAG: hypothetical protein ABSG53_08980 [Thermoguttaceae bacterium]|jgi:hypothetical protein
MDEEIVSDMTLPETVEDAGEMPTTDNPVIETASYEYLGRWNRLVSTTNWEKGRIVAEWRGALIEAGAQVAAYSDEAWSRRVGSVTPQHAGRLRRVYQRFASMRDGYQGLYWSHFQAALDWDDAEMWLEGAVQNRWSISQMQGERSRTLGALVEESVEAMAVEVDEDAAASPNDLPPAVGLASMAEARETAGVEAFEADASEAADESVSFDTAASYPGDEPTPVRPFENLPTLPADLRDAFDGFKLAIIHHRMSKWQEVSREDVLDTLEALRQLALAPAEAQTCKN